MRFFMNGLAFAVWCTKQKLELTLRKSVCVCVCVCVTCVACMGVYARTHAYVLHVCQPMSLILYNKEPPPPLPLFVVMRE